MMQTFKAELKKLLTVRSTYILSVSFLLLTVFLAFVIHGFKDAGTLKGVSSDRLFVSGSITQVASTLSVASAIIGLLLLAHEYRYNTIVYTLVASNSRSKVLLSKIMAVLLYIFVFSLIGTLLSLLFVRLGVAASHHTLPPQDINYVAYIAKVVFYCESFALVGLLFAAIIRNQVGAIAALFVLPNTIEGLLSLLLKHSSVYMPFTALSQVVQPPSLTPSTINEAATGYLSPVHGALVFLAYLVGGWILAWYLFLKRDAS
jgi:ABC-2 type transport system permease protein